MSSRRHISTSGGLGTMFTPHLALYVLLALAHSAFSWSIPHINVPTYTYQCMPIELSWTDGTPPYNVWFHPYDGFVPTEPTAGYGAWYNLTGQVYLVPCMAPAGSMLAMALKDSTGWISMSAGNFVVLPSTDSSCLSSSNVNAAGLSQSQSVLSTMLWDFQKSIISAISVSATAKATAISSVPVVSSTSVAKTTRISSRTAVPVTATATPTPAQATATRSDLPRILGPVLGCLGGLILGILLTICFLRRRRKHSAPSHDSHIPLSSTSAFDLLGGESDGHGRQSMREARGAVVDRRGSRGSGMDTQAAIPANTDAVVGTTTPGSRLRLHNASAGAWPSTVKHRLNDVPALPNEPPGDVENEPNTRVEDAPEQPRPANDPQTLEQRAEHLSAPELERLAALVARRLERVRGAPPQYQATEGVGV